jgi:hypothetical protein
MDCSAGNNLGCGLCGHYPTNALMRPIGAYITTMTEKEIPKDEQVYNITTGEIRRRLPHEDLNYLRDENERLQTKIRTEYKRSKE